MAASCGAGDSAAISAAIDSVMICQFVDSFDEIFRTEGLNILKTPVRTPVANTFAERWIGTLRRELLDRTIVWNQHQLEQLVTDYIDHYNTHRPHRSLCHRPPVNNNPPALADRDPTQLQGLCCIEGSV